MALKDNPIVITGMGIVSAIGNDVPSVLESLQQKRSGIRPLRYLNTGHTEFPVGEVQMTDDEMQSQLGLSPSVPMTRTALMGIMALREALDSAAVDSAVRMSSDVAFISGTTVGGMDKSEQYYLDFLAGDNHKEYIKTHDCGACTEMIADYFGDFAVTATPSTACSSAANAIIMGANMLLTGQARIAVAGGSECITKFHLNGFNTLMILDREPCRPFDATRAGLNLGEGAAYLVLERMSDAIARGVRPIAILAGWGNACDAFHQTASSDDGEGSYLSMKQALDRAGISPADVQYINAHGTGTPNNDASESTAMKRLFGDNMPAVSSTKSATGHTTSASGSIESVISLLALCHQFLPVNLRFGNVMPEGIVPVTDTQIREPLRNVLCNSFGFGGNDTSLIFSLTD